MDISDDLGAHHAEPSSPRPPKRQKAFHDDLGNGVHEARSGWLTSHDQYTIAWICALHIEMAAARAMLDEVYEDLPRQPNDSNTYTLGSIEHHNIVIACLPTAQYGLNNAANVLTHLVRTFPSIRAGLMVGIGGGAPSKADVHLGDIVVGTRVMQYDLGKIVGDGEIQRTAIPKIPHPLLGTAVSSLRAKHERDSSRIPSILREKFEGHSEYGRPSSQDRLFSSTYDHVSSTSGCDECDHSKLVPRSRRRTDDPLIHYGAIASGNQVMRSATQRDNIARQLDVICFEMEAAGLMDILPCLPIRGICDYSDSHKNKEWQRYAAAAAAAYARELLAVLPVPAIEMTEHIGHDQMDMCRFAGPEDVEYKKVAAAFRRKTANVPETGVPNPSPSLTTEPRQQLRDSLRFDQIDARHMTIKSAHARTCKWLKKKDEYLDWLNPSKIPEHHGFLWVKGKPGTGKSTVMKFALAQARRTMKDRIILSFFFNARGENLEKSTVGMYQSLLLQLLESNLGLEAIFDSRHLTMWPRDGQMQWRVEFLKDLFEQAVQSLGQSQVVCFVDALDECDEDQIRDMVSFFEHIGELAIASNIGFQVCFSSRHYPHITVAHGLELVLEGQEGHDQDIANYIDSELKIGRSKVAGEIRAELQAKASGVFMWVVLVVDILNKEHDRGRIHALRKRLREIPAGLHYLFRDILTRQKNYTFAVLAGTDPESLESWDQELTTLAIIQRFILDSSKGLAETTKSKTPVVQFIHESVRDFLFKDNGLWEIWPDLGDRFQGQSHERLKQCCSNYMRLNISEHVPQSTPLPTASSQKASRLRQLAAEKFPFLEYAVHNVLYHSDAAESGEVQQAAFIQDFPFVDWIALGNLLEKHEIRRHTADTHPLYIFAEQNLAHLIRIHPNRTLHLDIEGERYGFPLLAALVRGSEEAVEALMLDAKQHLSAEVPRDCSTVSHVGRLTHVPNRRDIQFRRGRSLVSYIAEQGDASLLSLLLATGKFGPESKDKDGRTLLLWAAECGHEAVVKLLLANDRVDPDAKDNNG
ncbi:Ankyrin repeat domain-containing protein 50 [Tolypocladium paradoxum]|uniref:Ankyrin repeat domain-containing protein 50 n=1 Tax=Tolypocladium paradoxum TaxID=94208 RepID=A0A2S4KPI5_9HYPO|nr:Ankyrin repeat domain-containing protein 50 [Tolypocladium paradoxum]